LMAGVDQFGGNSDAEPVLAAYQMGLKEHGEEFMRKRFEKSAIRLLKNIFRVGLFENPYLNAEETQATVGKPEFMKAGYDAQLKSVVLLKNQNHILPLTKNKTVLVPKQFTPAGHNFLGMPIEEKLDYPVNMNVIKKYFNVTDDPAQADYALVFINSPSSSGGYSAADVKLGGNGYVPIPLQYKPYTASDARANSIAGGDPLETFTNRTYKNKTFTAINTSDLSMVTDTYTKMKGKPVIVSVMMNNPTVFGEFEDKANALVVQFGVQDQALLDILTGATEPSGLLPLQMPADMHTVETQAEDLPLDMKCYKDSQGHEYKFGFGMNWKGVIQDARTAKYK
jgi:beta-glucosidase